MKQGTVTIILLFFLVLIVQDAWAADIHMNGKFLNSPHARFTGTVAGATDIQMDGNVDVIDGSVTATSFSGDGSALTNLNPANIASGTAGINISGNAATATTATTASSVGTGGVATAALTNGAVTPPKIAFYGRVAIVAISGGTYRDPATAMSDFTTWCPSLSSTNPCLLKILPGVYDVGSSPVVMQPFIDIEGSGENTTIIRGNIDGALSSGVVNGASDAELRFLTVKNSGGAVYAYAVYNSSGSPKMTNMTVVASGSLQSYGVFNVISSPIMTSVTVTASGGSNLNTGVYNASSSPTMTNVTITASGGTSSFGIYNYSGSGTVTINHSMISGSTNTIYNGSGVTTNVGGTQLAGGTAAGTVTCAGVYDKNYVFYASTCP